MGADKDYVVRVTTDTANAVTGIEKVESSLKDVKKAADKAGNDMKNAMSEVKRGAVGLINDFTGGLASKFMDVKDTIMGATKGLKGFKAALVGTGIGVLVVAIGALVGYREQLSSMFFSAGRDAKYFNDEAQRGIGIAKELSEEWSIQERRLRALGAAEYDLAKARKVSREAQLASARKSLEDAQKAKDAIEKDLQSTDRMTGAIKLSLGMRADLEKTNATIEESSKLVRELETQVMESGAEIAAHEKANAAKAFGDMFGDGGKSGAGSQKVEAAKEESAALIDVAEQTSDTLANVEAEMNAKMMEDRKAAKDTWLNLEAEMNAKQKEEREKAIQDELDMLRKRDEDIAKLEEMKRETVLFGIQFLGELAQKQDARSEKQRRRNFKIQKGANIATALMETYLAASKTVAAMTIPGDITSPARAAIAAKLTILQGLARVALIARQKFSGGGGGGDSGGGGGGGGGSFSGGSAGGGFATQSPVAPPPSIQNQQQAQPIQAYVLAGNAMANIDARKKIADQAKL